MHIRLKNHFLKASKEAKEVSSSFASCDNSAGGCAATGGVLLLNLAHYVNPYCMRVLTVISGESLDCKRMIKRQRGWDYYDDTYSLQISSRFES